MDLNIMKATVLRIPDGDTAILAIRWLDLTKTCGVRFAKVNAAEITSTDPVEYAAALAAKTYVENYIPPGSMCLVQSHILDKYGRVLGTIYKNLNDTKSLNQLLVDNLLVKPVSLNAQIAEIERSILKYNS